MKKKKKKKKIGRVISAIGFDTGTAGRSSSHSTSCRTDDEEHNAAMTSESESQDMLDVRVPHRAFSIELRVLEAQGSSSSFLADEATENIDEQNVSEPPRGSSLMTPR
ncbi:hypothetical protein EYF80_061742 [Liparis tanakae]|uniref:Uncharacterized protein n=1 Tax=Liparis tanakae TaxID=230148 RepID=A0A4Z2EHR4_9TELE|nr:hypothetical protein EYF80_061742 [Liparis tanakae]